MRWRRVLAAVAVRAGALHAGWRCAGALRAGRPGASALCSGRPGAGVFCWGRPGAGALCAVALCLAYAGPASAQTIWERMARPAEGSPDQLQQGLELEKTGDIAGAVEVYRAVGEATDSETARLYEQRALLSRPDETVALTEDALTDEPSLFRSQQLFFRALALIELRELEQAIEVLREATRFQTELPYSHLYLSNLAECYAALGEPEMAAVYFQQALNGDPRYPPASLGLAAAVLRSGDAQGFEYQLERVSRSNTTLATLRVRMPYSIVDGERHLYEAIHFVATGDPASAAAALEHHRGSDAARLTPPGQLDALQERIGVPWFTVTELDVPDCVVGWSSAVRNGRLATWCQDGSLRLHAADEDGLTLLESWPIGYNGEAYAMQDDGGILRLEWGDYEIHRFVAGATEPTALPLPGLLPSDGTRFFSPDGTVLWTHSGDGQTFFALDVNSPANIATVSLGSTLWGYNYASAPSGERFVMATNADHTIISQDGSILNLPHSDANPYATLLLVNDEDGMYATVGESEIYWRDASLSLLQRWRVPDRGYITAALMGDTNVVVAWSGTTVWLLRGRSATQ